MEDYTPITLDEAEKDLSKCVSDAVNFVETTFAEDWETAQEYYNGESGVKKVKGRSQVTSTNVRDAVRNLRPSLLRIFLNADTIVEYEPNGPSQQHLATIQSRYVNQLFFRVGGYRALYNAIQNAALKKNGILMYWWDDRPTLEYFNFTGVPLPFLQQWAEQPDLSIVNAEETQRFIPGPEDVIPLYDVTIARVRTTGGIRLESVPLNQFFISDDATSIQDAADNGAVGHSRSVPIHEALDMGIAYEDLVDLDDADPETQRHVGESVARRGYIKSPKNNSADPMNKRVLITQVFRRYDFDGTGVPQLYRFYLGGTTYKYLSHEPVRRPNYGAICLDFEADTFWGKSIYDLQKQEQDTMTSLLRATCDNAHLSNNRRLAVHETMVNMDDVNNPAIGAPIRVRSPGMIQEIGVQSSVGAMLPLLQYLQQGSEVKVGVSNAAVGLDPDALQSTTREAAMNTIQLSQGQIEVMARNVAEGLQDVFAGILELSLENMQPEQLLFLNGEHVPIDQTMFDPSLSMRPNVGLGTGQREEKLAGLTFVYDEQKSIVAQYGPFNPICGLDEIYNTLEDITKLHGIHNVSRYFKPVTEEAKQAIMQIMEAQAEDKPMDPARAMLQAEQLKAELRAREKQLEFMLDQKDKAMDRQIRALEFAATDDLERDRMIQQLYGAAAHKGHTAATQEGVDKEAVKALQAAPRTEPYKVPNEGQA